MQQRHAGRVSDEDTGDPMELALLRAGRLAGLERDDLLDKSPEIVEHAFDTTTKMMATVHHNDGAYFFAIKGAPEAVLQRQNASRVKTVMLSWMKQCERSGSHGSTSLALKGSVCSRSRRIASQRSDGPPFEFLTFLGLVGLEDPPRADVPDAISACHEAGIRVVMITGDHAVTARSIARAVGLGGAAPRVIEGRDLAHLTGEANARLLQTEIFARVSPTEKLQLVRTYQAAGDIVAVTGDGSTKRRRCGKPIRRRNGD